MSVFRFNIWFDGDSFDDRQERFVLAEDEQEAFEKMEAYEQKMLDAGFANFKYCGGWVEIWDVII